MDIKPVLLAEKHNAVAEAKFWFKTFWFTQKRRLNNMISPPPRHVNTGMLKGTEVLSVSESDLWNRDDNAQNWVLTAGKIENLRVASRAIHGIEVPAGEVFSFWRHVGRPHKGAGYVVGREIREGCIVPTVAGGLCQLSNALYDAALKANFTIVERHRHTKVIKGSLAELDRDATVKWNYVDLRFKAHHAFRIEVELTSDRLVVRILGAPKQSNAELGKMGTPMVTSILNDCYSCGNTACFKHPNRSAHELEAAMTTYVLDGYWPEYDIYLKSVVSAPDRVVIPIKGTGLLRPFKNRWSLAAHMQVKTSAWAGLKRMLLFRVWRSRKNVFDLGMTLDANLAKAIAKHIPIECTHLVVVQHLLPFLWKEGVLGGRTFDVLMSRLPMERLHERLDFAKGLYPDSPTLTDFRAPQDLIEAESKALTQARRIITPHEEIADLFANKCIRLEWCLPTKKATSALVGSKILFPASALGRKGAYELRRLAEELGLSVVVVGKAIEKADFWERVTVAPSGIDPFADIALVVYPTYIEHQPRLLLKAVAAGLPIITTPASGLAASEQVCLVPIGDYEALRMAVKEKLIRSNGLDSVD